MSANDPEETLRANFDRLVASVLEKSIPAPRLLAVTDKTDDPFDIVVRGAL